MQFVRVHVRSTDFVGSCCRSISNCSYRHQPSSYRQSATARMLSPAHGPISTQLNHALAQNSLEILHRVGLNVLKHKLAPRTAVAIAFCANVFAGAGAT